MEEVDHLLGVSPSGPAAYADGAALSNNINEWFSNAEGTIADYPTWGHNLAPYQHEPESEDLAIMVEMAIISKMPQDITGLYIQGVRIKWEDKDLMIAQVRHQFGTYEAAIAR